ILPSAKALFIVPTHCCEAPELNTAQTRVAPPRGRRLQASRPRIVLDQPIGHAVGVFAEDALAFHAVDVEGAFVIAGLNTSESVIAVHHVRLAINYRTTVKPRGEQIARINITARADLSRTVRGRIFVGSQL